MLTGYFSLAYHIKNIGQMTNHRGWGAGRGGSSNVHRQLGQTCARPQINVLLSLVIGVLSLKAAYVGQPL